MSFHAQPIPPIPEQTASVARKAFPKGSPLMDLRDVLEDLYTDEDFKSLFGRRGQPGWSAWRLAMITVMQYVSDLTDRQAAEAVRGRIDWKYALSLELDDSGIDASVLSEFRQRLIDGEQEQVLLNNLLARCQAHGWLKAGGRQRTDSTHVEAAIRTVNRLELIAETLRAALNSLAVVSPEWLKAVVSPDWFDRYGRRIEDYRLPKGTPKRTTFALTIGTDGHHLLGALDSVSQETAWLTQVPAVNVLRQVWIQQFYLDNEGALHLRGQREGRPPAGSQLCSPYDTEARFSRKRQTEWVGYKVHLTECCDSEGPHLITHVETTGATTADGALTQPIHQALHANALGPKEHLVDTAYLDAALLLESQTEYHIELVGPVLPDSSWQAQTENGFDITHFDIDWDQQQARCPQGQMSTRWKIEAPSTDHERVKIHFPTQPCQACSVKVHCTRAQKTGRVLHLRPHAQHMALQQARDYQQSDDFKQRYAVRAGIEGTLSQGIEAFGLRQCRYIGFAKTRLQHIITATAMNVVRLINWLHEHPLAQTRTSHFAQLANANYG